MDGARICFKNYDHLHYTLNRKEIVCKFHNCNKYFPVIFEIASTLVFIGNNFQVAKYHKEGVENGIP
ncbi:hypothetical protein ACA29_03270 [Lederbergia galactosidilytica]|uniref:Uncharacterized protein n=1 Tax=Lederbergia galactosidilytica TaxID=217031 RepID=A0A0Q9Y7F3_9BACI|nr:hypothetical protein ACA29_03270 [Lederbergia galactosidilytica]